ncbi:hypothetical protein PRAC110570_13210 [Propionibacterium acidifaciens]
MSATPATIAAPAATYSQLSFNQSPAAATPVLWASRQAFMSASLSGCRPDGSVNPTGLLAAYAYGLPAQPAPVVGSCGSGLRKARVAGS